jgi:hypothetical protein
VVPTNGTFAQPNGVGTFSIDESMVPSGSYLRCITTYLTFPNQTQQNDSSPACTVERSDAPCEYSECLGSKRKRMSAPHKRVSAEA